MLLVICVVLCGDYLAIGGCCGCLDSVYVIGDDFSLSRLERDINKHSIVVSWNATILRKFHSLFLF